MINLVWHKAKTDKGTYYQLFAKIKNIKYEVSKSDYLSFPTRESYEIF